jgi:hypothetical protein
MIGFSGKAAAAMSHAKDAASATAPTRRILWIFNLSTPVDLRTVDTWGLLLAWPWSNVPRVEDFCELHV